MRLGGTDKSTLILGGQPQFLRLWRAIRPAVARVVVNANHLLPLYRQAGCPVVPDAPDLAPGQGGPMAGVHAVWPHLQQRYVLLLPVDAVDFRGDFVPMLAHALMDSDAAIARGAVDGRVHPTCALVDRQQVTRPAHPAGSIWRWQAAYRCVERALPSGSRLSLNTPAELAAWRDQPPAVPRFTDAIKTGDDT